MATIIRVKRPLFEIYWKMITLFLIGACSFILITTFLNYLDYEIVTTITVKSEIPSKMPTVILCNSNGLSSNVGINFASKVFASYGITKSNNYLHYQKNEFARQLNNKGNILTTRTMVMTAARNPQLTDAFRQSLGLSIKDMLISCTFNSIECKADDFTWIYDTYYGNCYKFNGVSNYSDLILTPSF